MDPQTLGLIGGIAGGVIGVAGGLVGTMLGVRRATGPRERAFAVQAAVALWAAGAAVLAAGFLLLPPPFHALAGAPLVAALPPALRWAGRRLEECRRADAEELKWSH